MAIVFDVLNLKMERPIAAIKLFGSRLLDGLLWLLLSLDRSTRAHTYSVDCLQESSRAEQLRMQAQKGKFKSSTYRTAKRAEKVA